MIVMKFGGSSVANAERILAVGEIIRERVQERPVVVVSALAGVTDLLEQAIHEAGRSDLEGLEPILAEIERLHRWAISGSVEDADCRHRLSLEVDGMIDDLRRRLRSIRILGEVTPRAADAVLAFGEDLSSRIVTAALRDRGLAACHVDARRLLVTDGRFGAAQPDVDRSREACRAELLPRVAAGELPVVAGFVGSSASGETTTLGRGGSDTSAATIGLLLEAAEIQIWTDVDGLMSADPRLVPSARLLSHLSFQEAAELACHGARVLHPDSIAPAVRRRIPVRVLNSLRPGSAGRVITYGDAKRRTAGPVAVASRRGVALLRIRSRRMRGDAALLPRILADCAAREMRPELVSASPLAVTLALPPGTDAAGLAAAWADTADVERFDDRALLWVVGAALAADAPLRRRVLEGLSRWEPEMIAAGVSATSVAGVVAGPRLEACLRELHRQFFEEAS